MTGHPGEWDLLDGLMGLGLIGVLALVVFVIEVAFKARKRL